MRTFFIVTLLLISGWTIAPASASTDVAGHIKKVSGEVLLISAASESTAKPGDVVRVGDVIKTGAESSVGVTFRDETRTSLGANSEIVIRHFEFEPVEQKYAFVTRMVKGTLYYVSGLIAKLSPGAASVETTEATIGIRGTRFLLKVDGGE